MCLVCTFQDLLNPECVGLRLALMAAGGGCGHTTPLRCFARCEGPHGLPHHLFLSVRWGCGSGSLVHTTTYLQPRYRQRYYCVMRENGERKKSMNQRNTLTMTSDDNDDDGQRLPKGFYELPNEIHLLWWGGGRG